MKIDNELYKWIYKNINGYGQIEKGHCPGVRCWSYYKNWIKGPVIDLGCGTGQTAEYFRKNGIETFGVDYIEPRFDYCKQGDITRTMDLGKYKTATCFDVLEHVTNAQVKGLLTNMVQCDLQIFTVCNTPSIINKDRKLIDLHVNKKSWPRWRGIFLDYFDIYQEFEIRPYQHLYLCRRKAGDKAMIEYLENKGYIVTMGDE